MHTPHPFRIVLYAHHPDDDALATPEILRLHQSSVRPISYRHYASHDAMTAGARTILRRYGQHGGIIPANTAILLGTDAHTGRIFMIPSHTLDINNTDMPA